MFKRLCLISLIFFFVAPSAHAQFFIGTPGSGGAGSVGGSTDIFNNCSVPATPATKDAVCACLYTQKGIARCEFNQDTAGVFSSSQSECDAFCRGRQQACEGTGANCANDADCPGTSCVDITDSVEWDATGTSKRGKELKATCEQIEAQALLAKKSAFATALDIPPKPLITPDLFFNIPGLNFTEQAESGGFLKSRILSDYITAAYQTAISLSLIIAVVMIMIGGIQYILASGTGNVNKAKERIRNGVIGMTLLLCVYLILYLVNPNLTLFGSIQLRSIETEFAPKGIFLDGDGGYPGGGFYEQLAIKIGDKLGFSGCAWALQVAKESGWKPDTKTDCCYGLTQVHVGFVAKAWDELWPKITCLHSEGCPLCPPLGTTKKSIFADWLIKDPEGNLLYTALKRVEAYKKAENPVVATFYFGGGIRTHKDYVKTGACPGGVQRFTEEEMFEMLKKGRPVSEIVAASCIPNGTFSVSSGNSCTGSYQCCSEATGPCKRPKFTGAGRIGVCQGGPRAGQKCSAIAGGPGYMSSWLREVKKQCVK